MGLREVAVKIRVRSNPEPMQHFSVAVAYSTVADGNSRRPIRRKVLQLLEVQGWMKRIGLESAECPFCLPLNLNGQIVKHPPETWQRL